MIYKLGLAVLAAAAMLATPAVGETASQIERRQLEVQRTISQDVRQLATSVVNEKKAEQRPDPLVIPCKPGELRTTSDLCAQWHAARAAADAARYSFWTFWLGLASTLISVLGFGALVITIRQGRAANQIAQQTANHQLRAYIGVSEIRGAPDRRGHITARVLLKNYGSTPAANVKAEINSCIAKFPTVIDYNSHGAPKTQTTPQTLHPTAEFELYASSKIPLWHDLVAGKTAFYVYGHISYDDFNGEPRTTSFCYRGTESTLIDKGEMRISINGNAAD